MMIAAGFEDAVGIVSVTGLVGIDAGWNLVQPRNAKPYPGDQSKPENEKTKTLLQTWFQSTRIG